MVVLDGLKDSPFRVGDLHERDDDERANEILVEGDWIVAFWADHAAREMRVVRLENAEEGR